MPEAKTKETEETIEGVGSIDPSLFIGNLSREEKARRRGERALEVGRRASLKLRGQA